LVFTLAVYLIYPVLSGQWPRARDELIVDHPPESASRRALLGKAATGAIALVGVAYVGRFVVDTRSGSVGGGGDEVSLPITPNDEFYTVSKNFVDPNVGLGGWELQVNGLVNQQLTFSYDDLLAMPSVEQMATLTCISNEVGGDLIGNAVWTGVRLSDILARTGFNPTTEKIAFFGADGYSDSFELSKALEPTTIVAYLMNGERLPDSHGFPARLIVPGKYGIKNGKWLRRIQLVTDYRGYWQERGWTDIATIKTLSRFDVPGARAIVPLGPVDLGGIAFAGDRGIGHVEYSTDDGATWVEADQLQVISPLSWAIWRAVWTPSGEGAYELRVRATDGNGEVQYAERADPVPDGASGYHRRVIGVTG
jgi:DMSO/TMAO reductase YedYZ molybdopterin-dependent catalytic subunit